MSEADLWEQLKTESTPQPIDVASIVANECGQERARCASLIVKELDAARAAGIPPTSAAVRILERLRAAVENG
jgi:hypothetical protein